MNKNESAQMAPGEGVSHKARLRRKKREMAMEANELVTKEDMHGVKNPGRGGRSSHPRRDMYLQQIAGETEHYFDWLKCRLHPSEETKARKVTIINN